jgi:hypothetical protein
MFFQVRLSRVLRFISIYGLLTDSRSYRPFKEDFILACDAVLSGINSPALQTYVYHPSSQSQNKSRDIAGFFFLASCLAYSWALKMEAVSSSETSANLWRTMGNHIPEVTAVVKAKLSLC